MNILLNSTVLLRVSKEKKAYGEGGWTKSANPTKQLIDKFKELIQGGKLKDE